MSSADSASNPELPRAVLHEGIAEDPEVAWLNTSISRMR
jgi:hypothetical protein